MENTKKVTLLGDSIRLIGYGKHVPAMLGEGYTVYQPEDNCRFASYTLRMLFDLKNEIQGSDIVHWNNGLWDVCDLFGDGTFTDINDYVRTMVRIGKQLTGMCGKVIFATTTPVWPEYFYNRNTDIKAFNDAVTPELEKLGIVINDLYSEIVKDIPRYISSADMLHLSEEGEMLCAEKTVRMIKSLAG